LSEQEELIESLRADLKTAIRAYRHLVIEGENRDPRTCQLGEERLHHPER
jgi:hypothetical protein